MLARTTPDRIYTNMSPESFIILVLLVAAQAPVQYWTTDPQRPQAMTMKVYNGDRDLDMSIRERGLTIVEQDSSRDFIVYSIKKA